MEPRGLQGVLVLHKILLECPTETASMWRWVIQEPSSLLQMV